MGKVCYHEKGQYKKQIAGPLFVSPVPAVLAKKSNIPKGLVNFVKVAIFDAIILRALHL
jgi:hypothetical protein